MQTWPVITPWLLGAGLIGFVLALVALRVRQRWLMSIALLLLMGPVLVCGSRWRVIDLSRIDQALYASSFKGPLAPPPGTEEMWIQTGTFPEAELAGYIKRVPKGSNFDRLEWLATLAASNQLHANYHRAFARTVVDRYSAAGATIGGREMSLPAALALSDIEPVDRSAIIDLMIAHRAPDEGKRWLNPVQDNILWLPALQRELLAGKLSETQRNALLDSIAAPNVLGPAVTQLIRPGELFCIDVGLLESSRRSDDNLPWKASFGVKSGPFEVLSKPATFVGFQPTQKIWMKAPSEPVQAADAHVQVIATAQLTRDSVHLARSKVSLPYRFPVHEMEDIRHSVTVNVPILIAAVDSPATPQTISTDNGEIEPLISLEQNANAWTSAEGMDVEIVVKVNSPNISMAFDARVVDGPTIYELGKFIAIEGEPTTWSLRASGVQNTPYDTYVELTPCPEVLTDTPRVKTVYGGAPLRLPEFRLIYAGDH